jgi:hypothetical protein
MTGGASLTVTARVPAAGCVPSSSFVRSAGQVSAQRSYSQVELVRNRSVPLFLNPPTGGEARHGPVIGIASEGDPRAADYVAVRADEVIQPTRLAKIWDQATWHISGPGVCTRAE